MATKPVPLLKNCAGLHLGVDEIRAKYNFDTGATFFAACANVKVESGNRVSRRKGYTLKNACVVREVFSDKVDCIVLTNQGLLRVNPDFTLVGLHNGFDTTLPMWFAATPEGIYYNNQQVMGCVKRFGIATPWVSSGQEYAPIKSTLLSGPPRGTVIHYHNGRMFIADGRVAWYSDYRSYGNFHQEEGMLHYPDNVIGFASAAKTLFVFTERYVYSYTGETIKNSVERVVSTIPAIPGTTSNIDAPASKLNTLPVWSTLYGIFAGTLSGEVVNLTDTRFVLPDTVTRGKAVCHNGEYIALYYK